MAASAMSERKRGIERESEQGVQQDPGGHGECVCVIALEREGQAGSCVPARASAVRCFPSAFW